MDSAQSPPHGACTFTIPTPRETVRIRSILLDNFIQQGARRTSTRIWYSRSPERTVRLGFEPRGPDVRHLATQGIDGRPDQEALTGLEKRKRPPAQRATGRASTGTAFVSTEVARVRVPPASHCLRGQFRHSTRPSRGVSLRADPPKRCARVGGQFPHLTLGELSAFSASPKKERA